MLNRSKYLTARGDTIVEVMIVLAILGLAIGIAYSTANRSLLNIRQSQENSEAVEYVQSQVEDLRILAAGSVSVFSQNNPFCLSSATGSLLIYPYSAPPPVSTANCSFGSVPYTVEIYNCDKMTGYYECSGISSTSDTFVIEGTWPDVLGKGTDTVSITYRDHAKP